MEQRHRRDEQTGADDVCQRLAVFHGGRSPILFSGGVGFVLLGYGKRLPPCVSDLVLSDLTAPPACTFNRGLDHPDEAQSEEAGATGFLVRDLSGLGVDAPESRSVHRAVLASRCGFHQFGPWQRPAFLDQPLQNADLPECEARDCGVNCIGLNLLGCGKRLASRLSDLVDPLLPASEVRCLLPGISLFDQVIVGGRFRGNAALDQLVRFLDSGGDGSPGKRPRGRSQSSEYLAVWLSQPLLLGEGQRRPAVRDGLRPVSP